MFMNLDYRRFRFTLATLCSSQYLKELFISCFLSLSIFPPVSPLESGCKGKTCFSFSKLFKLFFSNFFSGPSFNLFPSCPLSRELLQRYGNDSPFSKFFHRFFSYFFQAPGQYRDWQNVREKNFYRENGKDHREKGGKGGTTGKRDRTLARQAPFMDTRERL